MPQNQNAPSKSGGMDELEVYEQVEEETQSYGLDRKTSLFCKLKTALNQRQQVKQGVKLEPNIFQEINYL